MQQDRRESLQRIGCAIATATGLSAPFAHAAAFPTRPVRLIYPFQAGGMGDMMARSLSNLLSQTWKQPVLVDNKPGAGGLIGADVVAKAEPDGHTLLFTFTALVQVPSMLKRAPFNPLTAFTPISELATTHAVLVVDPALPVHSVRELVAYAQRSGTSLAYGTYGVGSSGHLLMEILAKIANIQLTAVAYKGEAPLVSDMLGRQIQVGFLSASSAQQHLQSGKLRGLAVAGESRSPLLPDLPNFSDAGYPQLKGSGWLGLFAPAKTPSSIIERIYTDVQEALKQPALRAQWIQAGLIVRGTTPAEFTQAVRQQHAYWSSAIQSTGIRLD